MGVERQHCILYGYRFDYDELSSEKMESSPLVDNRNHRAERGDFVVLGPGRGGSTIKAGIVIYQSDSTRWDGAQTIPLHVIEDLTVAEKNLIKLGQKMEQIEAEPIDKEPKHLVFTDDW